MVISSCCSAGVDEIMVKSLHTLDLVWLALDQRVDLVDGGSQELGKNHFHYTIPFAGQGFFKGFF